ncbi:hypothetical protein B0H10DRAFT_2209929 [Mycena sp. CBHHK59/15]|nr:hypothetical protein B0H10DRAFT_2209929 [Mycena sp. CBHHK59/15]
MSNWLKVEKAPLCHDVGFAGARSRASSRPMATNKKRKQQALTDDVHTHTHTFSIGDLAGPHSSVNDPITTFVDRSSIDNRRRYQAEVTFEPPSPFKRQAQAAPQPHPFSNVEDLDSSRYEMGFDADDEGPSIRQPRGPRIVKPSDPELHRFRGNHDAYLADMLRREGCMRANPDVCQACKKPTEPEATPSFRRHQENPLHRIERWNGVFFVRTSLRKLGLRVQLGHPPHKLCPEPTPVHVRFVVLHTNGIHEINVDVCDFEHRNTAGTPEEQMLRAGWFPATDLRARTCATFACLDLFLLSTHQSKTTMYDFYAMLEKLTDNSGVKPPNRYHAFI